MSEPAAPGTEDEAPFQFPAVSKQDSEQQRLLSLKAYLPNGKCGNVFELSYVNGSEHWYCNVCECPVMGRVYHHEIGKRHTSNISNKVTYSAPPQIVSTEPPIQIAPGEPVPPGFEGEIEKIAQIQDRLDNYKVGPLIGLEYLLEIQEYDREKEPSYLCMSCDKRGDPRTVIAHLGSYNHINQYLQKHFPTCYRALSPYITKQYKRNWQNVVQKIAEAIENKFGRLKPHPVELETFEQKRMTYLDMVVKGPHFSEKSGYTFEELVDKKELTKNLDDVNMKSLDASKNKKRSPSPPVVARPTKKAKAVPSASSAAAERRRSLSSVSSISSSDLSDYDEKRPKDGKGRSPQKRRSPYRPNRDYNRQRKQSPPRQRGGDYRNPKDRPDQNNGGSKNPKLPWQRPEYARPRSDFVVDNRQGKKTEAASKWDDYKKLAQAIENDMAKTLKQHEKNPEKHPQYNDEWKKFWNRRYKELQAEGKDAAKHDFKPEWIVFWNKRMVELHNNDVKAKKDALRKRLGLPEEPAPICFRITGKKKPSPNDGKLKPMAATPDVDPEVIIIDDKEETRSSSRRSHSPWEQHEPKAQQSRRSRERSYERRRTPQRIRSRSRSRDGREARGRDRDTRSRERDIRSRDRDVRSRERTMRSRDRDIRSRDRDREPVSKDRDVRSRDADVARDYVRELSWERDAYHDPYRREMMDIYKPPRVMRDVTRQPVLSPLPYVRMTEPEPEEDDGNINVVGVLRLLTALEEKLGSLGPKIIDLLAQALAMEKNEANSSETLLDNDVNCVLFETVKEKLKGQLLAGLVEYAQEKAFKNAIKKIASLIHFAGERKKEKAKATPKTDPVKVPGVGTVDKAAIAKQIATALVLQGKTDVTQQELEQLINAVVGMAEASRNSNKPMTTAQFLQQLTSKPAEPNPKPAGESKLVAEIKKEPMTSALQALQCDDTSSMDGLSDSDLQTLLQNFKDLSTTEQHGLIGYLKKLEAKEPERVERLRKFVNLGQESEKVEVKKETGRRLSPFSNRLSGGNPMVEERETLTLDDDNDDDLKKQESKDGDRPVPKMNLDSDDEEYSFEDVFKAAKEKVTENEAEKERRCVEETKRQDLDLKDAKAIIANLMGNLQSKTSTAATPLASTINVDRITDMVSGISSPAEPIPTVHVRDAPPVRPSISYVQYPIRSVGYGYSQQQGVQYPVRPQYHPPQGQGGYNAYDQERYNTGPPNPNQYNRQGSYGSRW